MSEVTRYSGIIRVFSSLFNEILLFSLSLWFFCFCFVVASRPNKGSPAHGESPQSSIEG